MFNCGFVTFPCGILGQVWYLIVSIPDICRLSYFDRSRAVKLYGLFAKKPDVTKFLSVKLKIFSYPSVITYVLGAQKNR